MSDFLISASNLKKANLRWQRSILRSVDHEDKALTERCIAAMVRGDKTAVRALFEKIKQTKIQAVIKATENYVDDLCTAAIIKPDRDRALAAIPDAIKPVLDILIAFQRKGGDRS